MNIDGQKLNMFVTWPKLIAALAPILAAIITMGAILLEAHSEIPTHPGAVSVHEFRATQKQHQSNYDHLLQLALDNQRVIREIQVEIIKMIKDGR